GNSRKQQNGPCQGVSAHFLVGFDAGLDKVAIRARRHIVAVCLEKVLRPLQRPPCKERGAYLALIVPILSISLVLGLPGVKGAARGDPVARALPSREKGLMGDFGGSPAIAFSGDHDALLRARKF